MNLLLLFGVGLSTGLSGAMVPGPLTLYVVSEAFRRGRAAGLKIAAGHLLIESAFAGLIVFGLRDYLSSPGFRTAVVWVGCAGLIAMGAVLLRQVPGLSLTQRADVAFGGGPVAGGAFFSLTSPGFLIWWATIGASVFLEGALQGPAGLAAVGAGHALADIAWCWFVAYSIERGRRYVSDRTYRVIMAGIAVWLIMLGLGLPLKHYL
jgi:threonine/homoserine/homoserine lactone efflux protein